MIVRESPSKIPPQFRFRNYSDLHWYMYKRDAFNMKCLFWNNQRISFLYWQLISVLFYLLVWLVGLCKFLVEFCWGFLNEDGTHGNPKNLRFLGVISPICLGFETFIFRLFWGPKVGNFWIPIIFVVHSKGIPLIAILAILFKTIFTEIRGLMRSIETYWTMVVSNLFLKPYIWLQYKKIAFRVVGPY